VDRIPKVNVIPGDTYEDYEIEIGDDPEDTIPIPIIDIPICVTLTQLGQKYIVDTTLEEEQCLGCRLTIAVNKNSSICCIQKGGHGSVSSTTLKSMIQTAQSIGKVIIDKQDIAIKEESKLNKEKIGFFL